ncbi:2-nitropropane dioxygenase [Rhizopus microsporus ATCC 52813]|uniref:2-nitropropane dioxygenase n=1 Tax=Rhizopus microsporus ATCC 52813 TaxID=1340429 RepID=A0A2G4SZ71_RHIZD|nr:2-nitropropane dioxygenase [Rhizopus microsporus ATCC 52813]PHZ14068.1 2-nitropropane dioxygenase [Rhizopus microsporus ATCC 52813]
MVLVTRITQLLGIKHPIIQGGMQHVGKAELASAVSNSGALGILTALTQPTPEDLRKEIRRCREMTDKPFGVNMTFLPALRLPPYKDYAQVIIEEGVKIVETAGNNPGEFIKMFKDADIKTIHKCVAVRHALTAQRLGVDAVSMDGFECAGHPGEDDITGLILLAKSARKLNIPFIASGGIGDGRGLAAALALGAEGVNMGTRFLCTKEAPIHEAIKQKMVEADERSTALVYRPFRNTARIFKNKVAVEVNEIERTKEDLKFEDIAELVSGTRGKQVFVKGDPDLGIWIAGQVLGLIDDIPTCHQLVTRMIDEAETIISQRLRNMIV